MDTPTGNPAETTSETQKWQDQIRLREREIVVKEREQEIRDREVQAKIDESRKSKWGSPLVLAVLAAAVAALGNGAAALISSRASQQVEETKAEAARILELIKTGDPDRAASNLEFLLELGLISEPNRATKLRENLRNRIPGLGPSLPSNGVGIEPTELLTESLRESLQGLFERYVAYAAKIGLPKPRAPIGLKIINLPSRAPQDASFLQQNSIVVHPQVAADPSLMLPTYNNYLLAMGATRQSARIGPDDAISAALSDYLAASYLDNPRIGEVAAKMANRPDGVLRNLVNARKYSELSILSPESRGEVWGGAFWHMRDVLGRRRVDPMLVGAWHKTIWPENEGDRVAAFLQSLMWSAQENLTVADFDQLTEVFRVREFPLANSRIAGKAG